MHKIQLLKISKDILIENRLKIFPSSIHEITMTQPAGSDQPDRGT